MKKVELEERIFEFVLRTVKFINNSPVDWIYREIYRQLLCSSSSIGANWQEAIGGLTNADFVHSANIAKKEARESFYWLRLIRELKMQNFEEINFLCGEADELIAILTSIVKKVQTRSKSKTIKKIGVFFLCFVFSSLPLIPHPSSLSLLYAADWPVFRGNSERTGFTEEQAYPPLTKVWEYQTGANIMSSPAVFEDIVYFGSRDNKVYALNARTGDFLWSYPTTGWVDAGLAVSSSAVYAPSKDGHLYSLNRLTGAPFWKKSLGAPSISSPLVLDGKVFVGAGAPEKKLKVFDEATGNLLSEYSAQQPVDSAPSASGDIVYFGANDGKIYAINKNTYLLEWNYQATGGRYSINAVAVSSGNLYAVPGYDEKKPLVFNALTGSLLNNLTEPFSESASWEQMGSPVVTSGRMFFSGGASVNTFYATNTEPAGGALEYVWASSPTLGSISPLGILSSPAMANDLIYVGSVDGSLLAFSSEGVSVPLAADVSFSSAVYSSPAISNGMIFLATSGGKLIAYKAAKTAAISSPKKNEIITSSLSITGYVSNPDLAGYSLEYGQGEYPSSWSAIVSSDTANAIEGGVLAYWDINGLENGIYTLKLSAVENPVSGTDNTARLTVRINAPPIVPTELAAIDVPADNGNQIKLDWLASSSAGLAAYRIYRKESGDFSLIASVSSNTLTYTDATAVTGSTFTYAARAFDGYVESDNSNLASAFSINNLGDFAAPSAINDLTAVPGPAAGMVLLVWTAPGNDGAVGTASHYLIRRATIQAYDWSDFDGAELSGGTRGVEGPFGAREAEEVDGLFGGVTYYFAIKTADFVPNLSQLSNIATSWATIDLHAPAPATDLQASDTLGDEGGSLSLTWKLSSDDGAGYDDVYGYKVYRRLQNSSYVSSSPFASVLAGTTFYVDSTATSNIRFYYSLAAFDSTNNSQFSNEAWSISADNWRFFDSSQGGEIKLADGAIVSIPSGAANQNGKLMMNRVDTNTYKPMFSAKANTQANPTSIVYEVKFKDSATQLIIPATLTLPYTDAEIDGMNESNLRIYTLSEGTWLMANTSKVLPDENKVIAEVKHFSLFRIMEYIPSGDLMSKNSVYTYPNPAKGDNLTFKFHLADKAFVTVEIYNVAGEKVAKLEKANCPAGIVSEILWDIKNYASGVYIYKVEAVSASGSKKIIKKLAIVH
ncbi:MAG: four helix bundle protein [Elusimicrobia bacterium]|nr:four helix bundle protein [Elusimicrobiota bacterium]